MKLTLTSPLFLIIIFITTFCNKSSCSPLESLYITTQCKTTLYPDLCAQSLSKYSEPINRNPRILATTALSFTRNDTKSTLALLRNMPKTLQKSVSECVEVVSDSLFNLERSIKRMDQFETGPEFEAQMTDIETWVSAALTDDNTCMDDFPATAETRAVVRRLVTRTAHLTSVALAFVNQYAAD